MSERNRRGRVLVVDDEQCIVDTLRRILRSEHEVITCTSPSAALAWLMAGERYDAILLDLMMPTLTGMELHEALVRYCPEQAERIIFVTAGATRETHEVFLRTVPLPCLRKPFNLDGVREMVRKVVGT